MGVLRWLVLVFDIFVLIFILELVLSFIRPTRMMQNDGQTAEEVRCSQRYLRIVLTLLLALAFGVLWASWTVVLKGAFR